MVNLFPSFLVKFFARAYVAGVGIDSGIKKARDLWEKHKITSTIDMLGEEVTNLEEVEKIVQIYTSLVEKLQDETFPKHISLKPTSLGIDIDKDLCLRNLEQILKIAVEAKITVTLDMEDSNYTNATLELYKTLKPRYEFGTVLQSRLFRTKDDILSLTGFNARVRMCIGVYNEDSSIAYTEKNEMKKKIVEFTGLLLDNGHQVDIATHDHKCIVNALKEVEDRGLGKDNAEFQFLLGVPRQRIQNELIARGYTVRLYVPFTIEWKCAIAYLRRRLIENPSMIYLGGLDFLGRILQPLTKRRRKPILPPEHTSSVI
ncbi:MAG: proline dehydrogenase family protein [Candidatus Hodarchaeales archaeon]